MSLQTRYTPAPDVICTELDDGEAVLLHLISRQYYTLNETGARIWGYLADGLDVDQMIEHLIAEYELGVEEARSFIEAYLSELRSEGLVEHND